jgi:Yip1 domain
VESPPPLPASQAVTSTWTKLLNIFVTPGEVFEEVSVRPSAPKNWLVPGVIYGFIGAIAAVLVISHPAILQQARDQQAKMMDEMVKQGKMTRERAEQDTEAVEKITGPIMKGSAMFGGLVSGFIQIIWWAFLLWLIGRFGLKAQLDFSKTLEVVGLASGIAILDTTLRTLLIVILGNPFASLSLVLLIPNPRPDNHWLGLSALVNPLTFWLLAVRSIGLAKLTGVPAGKAAAWVFPVWLLTSGGAAVLGLGAQILAQKMIAK